MANLPSTKALRAFEAAARLGSLKAAADYLSVTPSALSRRIQALEEELGQALFWRDPRGIVLTDAGRLYAERLRRIFSSLAEATDAARTEAPKRIRLLIPGLYAMLVMKYLKEFEARHPDIEVSLDIYSGEIGSESRIAASDIVIYYGDGKLEGWESVSLAPFGAYTYPVCAPDYLPDGTLDDAQKLCRFTWIRISGHPDIWNQWCAAVGLPELRPKNYFDVNSGIMARTAALNGMGIWLSGGMRPQPPHRYLTTDFMLAHPFHAFLKNLNYYLAYQPQSPNDAPTAAFINWMTEAIVPQKTAT